MKLLRHDVTREQAGQRLDHLLHAWLPGALGLALSKSVVRRLIMAGAVSVNGRPLRRAGRALDVGDRLDVRVAPERLQTRDDVAFVLTRDRVLYEDDGLIAVDKPPGIATVPTVDPARPHLVGLVERYLAAQRPEVRPYVGIHQRLDRETSGVVLFTKDPAVNPALARAFAAHEIVKTYQALTQRAATLPPHAWTVDEPLDGAPAQTDFTLVEVLPRALRVEARPRSGRKHQIRIHLSSRRLSILGDERYGAHRRDRGAPAPPRLMLHASALVVPHPLTGRRLTIESPLPADFRRMQEALSEPAPARRHHGAR